MDLTVLDWVLFGVTAFFIVVGLFRGFSGQLGSFVGIAVALVAGYFLFAPLRAMVVAGNWVTGGAAQSGVAAGLDFIAVLIIFGLGRRAVAKFVSFLVPQPMNALAGGLVGLFMGAVAVAGLTGVGLVQTGRFSEGFFAAHSAFVRMLGSFADAYMQGAAGGNEGRWKKEEGKLLKT